MPRIRTIKPQFALDEELAELSATTRLFFILLWTHCDREGRCEDRPRWLWANIFPYEPGVDVEVLLKQLEPNFITRYAVAGKRYIQVTNFLKHQLPHYKEIPSSLPAPKGQKNSGYNAMPVKDSDREAVFKRDGGQCRNCGTNNDLTIDHITPRSRGGGPDKANLQVLCRSCNSSKNNNEATLAQHKTNINPILATGREGKGREGKRSNYINGVPCGYVDKSVDNLKATTDCIRYCSYNDKGQGQCSMLVVERSKYCEHHKIKAGEKWQSKHSKQLNGLPSLKGMPTK